MISKPDCYISYISYTFPKNTFFFISAEILLLLTTLTRLPTKPIKYIHLEYYCILTAFNSEPFFFSSTYKVKL